MAKISELRKVIILDCEISECHSAQLYSQHRRPISITMLYRYAECRGVNETNSKPMLKNALEQISQTFEKNYGGKCKSAQLNDNLQVLTVI